MQLDTAVTAISALLATPGDVGAKNAAPAPLAITDLIQTFLTDRKPHS